MTVYNVHFTPHLHTYCFMNLGPLCLYLNTRGGLVGGEVKSDSEYQRGIALFLVTQWETLPFSIRILTN